MLRVLFIILSFSMLACSLDQPAPVAPAGKAACEFCDFFGGPFVSSQEESTADDEADTTPSSDDETDPMEPEIVSFADANLERAVRWALRKPEGPLTADGLASLTRLDVEGQNIKSLDGLEYATALDTLNLLGNEIEDISPLSDLTNLTFLRLGDNQVVDVSPLSSLTNLKWLSLSGNQVEDVSPLSSLTKLQKLNLLGNEIEDVSPLSDLTNLRWLNLGNNKVEDVSALDGLTNLDWLGLLDNPINQREVNEQVPSLIERDVTISLVRSESCAYPTRAFLYTAGTPISPLVLPPARGGTPPITYTTSGLPPGLSFDPVARTVRGTPNVVIESRCGISYTVTYRISDSVGASISRTFLMFIRP